MPMLFLESPDGGDKLIQVPAMEATVQEGPTESQFIQSADRLFVELAPPLPPPNVVHPVGKLPVRRVAPRHIAMPVFLFESLQLLEALFPGDLKIDAPGEADLVKLLDLGFREHVLFLRGAHFATQDASLRFFGHPLGTRQWPYRFR